MKKSGVFPIFSYYFTKLKEFFKYQFTFCTIFDIILSKKSEKGEIMQACTITIATTVDGKCTEIIRNGEMALNATCVKLRYFDEQATVFVVFENNEVSIDRQGDYSMRLLMRKGEVCDGVLGIGGSTGAVQTQTRRIAYSQTKNSFTLALHYDLIIGGEIQKMRIRLSARGKE